MAIRYSAKLYSIFEDLKQAINDTDLSDDKKRSINAIIAYGQGFVQAGRMIANGNTVKGLETLTGMTTEQIKNTAQYREIHHLEVGDTIVIACPRSWFNFARAVIKSETPSKRFRAKTDNESLVITRLK